MVLGVFIQWIDVVLTEVIIVLDYLLFESRKTCLQHPPKYFVSQIDNFFFAYNYTFLFNYIIPMHGCHQRNKEINTETATPILILVLIPFIYVFYGWGP